MKKIISLIISIIIAALAVINVSAEGETKKSGNLTFTGHGTYCELTACYEKAAGGIVIPEIVAFGETSLPVTAVAAKTFYISINDTLGENETSIDWLGEAPYSGITSVTIPKSVTSIGEKAFYDCKKIETVYYKGTEEEWNDIDVAAGNDPLLNAEIVFDKPITPGDTNNDGKVNNKDVVTLFRIVAQGNVEYNKIYDFNNDNKANNKDVVALFRFINT